MNENTHEADAHKTAETETTSEVTGGKHLRKKPRRGLWIALAVACVLAGGYAFGYFYFATHYAPGTRVLGIDASGKDTVALEQALDELVATYSCHVTAYDLDLTITGAALGLTCDAKGLAHDVLAAQNRALWPVQAFIGGREAGAVLDFDEVALMSIISAEVAEHNQDARPPVSATLALNESGTAFVVVDEQPGSMLDAGVVTRAMGDAVRIAEPELPLGDKALATPAHLADAPETRAALERANGTLASVFSLVSSDGTVKMTMDGDTFAPWLRVEDDLSLTIDADAAAKWADATCAQVFDTVEGNEICCVDGAAFAESLQDAVFVGHDTQIQMPLVRLSRHLPAEGKLVIVPWEQELGRYLLVDKETQTACLYGTDGAVLWESTVTTGNEASGDGTPAGTYSIYEKRRDFTLLGNDVDGDGEPDYEHHVNWWMPFYGSIGLHDAEWREEYGGDHYLESGSGGCVNLPADAAEALYQIIHVGDTVVIREG